MAGRGPAPKRRAHRRGELAAVTDITPVEVPDLRNRESYCAETGAWYDAMAALPQAREWGPGNWLTLQQTAPVACKFYCGDLKWAAELRLRQTALEVTDADLRRAGKNLGPSTPSRPAAAVGDRVSAAEARRQRLLQS